MLVSSWLALGAEGEGSLPGVRAAPRDPPAC